MGETMRTMIVQTARRRGFTMIEVMIALAILLIASVGALMGLMAAQSNLKTGQLHQYQAILVEAAVQRFRLADKQLLLDYANNLRSYPPPPATGGQANPTAAQSWVIATSGDPTAQAVDSGPWGKDPWTGPPSADSLDLSTGKFFRIMQSGEIKRLTVADGAWAGWDQPCSGAPVGTFCREVAIIPGASVGLPGPVMSAGFRAATVWIRISQVGQPLALAYVAREVVAQ